MKAVGLALIVAGQNNYTLVMYVYVCMYVCMYVCVCM